MELTEVSRYVLTICTPICELKGGGSAKYDCNGETNAQAIPPILHKMQIGILVDIEIRTYPCMPYPSLEEFLASLEEAEPDYGWTERVLVPLKRSGIHTLEHVEVDTPLLLHTFFGVPAIVVMDLFSYVLETIEHIHQTESHDSSVCVGCRGQATRYGLYLPLLTSLTEHNRCSSPSHLPPVDVDDHDSDSEVI